MKEVRTHLSEEEYEFVKDRPRSFMRTLIQQRMAAPEFVPPDQRMLGMVVPMIHLFQEGLIDKDEVRRVLGFEVGNLAPDPRRGYDIDGGQ